MTIWQKAGLVLSSQSLTPVNARGTALVAIAPDIQDPELLLSGVETGVPAIILDNNHNAVEQITEALTQSSASSLHIVCHGAPGTLKLGKTTLTSANIGQYTHLLQEWGVTNILLWACEVAQNPEFLTTLHQLTGANIAASTQVIGNSATYRNWQLESQIGDMVTEPSVFTPATLQNYSGLFVDPGSNFLTAQNIGVLGATQNFSEVVGTTDRNDYYKFTLNQISAVNLNLTGLEEPAQLQIVTDLNGDGILGSGEDIEYDNISDFSSSIADRSISGKVLSPGTYAIRVYTYDSDQNTSYDLSASATALPPTNPTDPGSSFQAARNIGTLGALQTFTDAVGTLDLRDNYKFTLNEISQVSLNLTGLTEPAQLAIATDFDNDGIVDSNEFIEYDNISDFSSSIDDRGISRVLVPGTYAISVYPYYSDQNTGYTLAASATNRPPTNPTDPGEDFDSARNLGPLRGTRTFTDAVGSLDRNDYYKFTLSQSSPVSFNLTGLTEPAQLALATDLDNDGEPDSNEFIEFDDISDFSSSIDDRGISQTLAPGTYFARVYAYYADQNTGYTLTTTAPGEYIEPGEIEYTSRSFTVNGVFEPIPGDFNGDGNGDVLWYRPGTGSDFIWSFEDDGTYDSEPFTVNGDFTPVPGDFDGSGTTDILWYRPGTGADFIWSFNPDGTYTSRRFTVNGDFTPVTGDFDASGTTDILWYRPGTGSDFLWSFNPNGTYSSKAFPVNGVFDPVTGDFDGSGTTDILWYRPGTGADFLWSFNPNGTYNSKAFPVNGTYEPIEGDFNGDEIDDILWYRPGTGDDFIWTFQNDGSYSSTDFNINGVYTPVVEDFDSNGFTDILWYRPGTASDFVWSFE